MRKLGGETVEFDLKFCHIVSDTIYSKHYIILSIKCMVNLRKLVKPHNYEYKRNKGLGVISWKIP